MEPSHSSASSASKSSSFSCSTFGCACLGDEAAAGWGPEAGAGRAAAVRWCARTAAWLFFLLFEATLITINRTTSSISTVYFPFQMGAQALSAPVLAAGCGLAALAMPSRMLVSAITFFIW